MKTINNYINERLNPKHLGRQFFCIDKPTQVYGDTKFAWKWKGGKTSEYGGSNWMYGVYLDKSDLLSTMFFWSKDCDYILWLNGASAKSDQTFNGIVEADPGLTGKTNEVYKNFLEYCKNFFCAGLTPLGLHPIDGDIEYSDNIKTLIEQFAKIQ